MDKGPLNFIRMTEMYREKMSLDLDTAKKLAKITKGYPYAFQELGVLYFKKKSELFAYAYEKIWEEMTMEDRLLVSLKESGGYSREDFMSKMKNPKNYSVYRDRLLRRGNISARRGYISLALPFFDEYIRDYCG